MEDAFDWLFDDTATNAILDHVPRSGAYASTAMWENVPHRPCKREENMPFVGLLNQGSTCYLNSLIQALFLTPEFRNAIFSIPLEELGLTEDLQECLSAGADIDFEQHRSVRRIIVELGMLFARLQFSHREAVSTKALTTSFGWSGEDVGVQHDVHELNRVLFDALEQSLLGTSAFGVISNLYKGVIINRITCSECGGISSREEQFMDIGVVVKGQKSLIGSLQEMVKVEWMKGDNQYRCEQKCNGQRVDARRQSTFSHLPEILTFSLLRFEYDWNRGRRTKNGRIHHYPLVLDMAPFCDSPPPPTGEGESAPITSKACADIPYQGRPKCTEETPHEEEATIFAGPLHESSAHIKNSVCSPVCKKIRGKKKKRWGLHEPSIATANSTMLYDLFAVIIHVGSGGDSGHYHAYIRNVVLNDKEENQHYKLWADFNDSSVSFIDEDELENQFGGSSQCAYMLLYRKRKHKSSRLDAIVPPCFHTAVANENVSLESEIKQWEEKVYCFDLIVDLPGEYAINEDGFLVSLSGKCDASEELTQSRCVVRLDKRRTLGDSLDVIAGTVASCCASFQSVENLKDMELLGILSVNEEGIVKTESQGVSLKENLDILLDSSPLASLKRALLWNSQTINGVPYDPRLESVNVHLKLLTSPHTSDQQYHVESEEITLSNVTSASSFRQKLESSHGLHPSSQVISVITNDVEQRLPSLADGASDAKLVDIVKLCNGTSIVVISKNEFPNGTAVTVLEQYVRRHSKMVEVTVIDAAFSAVEDGNDSSSAIFSKKGYAFLVEKEMTLYELKAHALEELSQIRGESSPSLDCDKVLLRGLGIGKYVGAIFKDEKLSLQNAGVVDSPQVILERGESPTKSSQLVKYVYEGWLRHKTVRKSEAQSDAKEMTGRSVTRMMEEKEKDTFVERLWSVGRLQQHLSSICGLDSEKQPTRMRRTDLWGNPASLFCDLEKTVAAEHIDIHDVILLENGNLPASDEFALSFKLFSSCSSFSVTDVDGQRNTSCSLFSPSLCFSRPIPSDFCFYPLLSLNVKKSAKLKDVITELLEKEPLLSERTASNIRLWSKQRLLKDVNQSLEKHYLSSNSVITVELVESIPSSENSVNLQQSTLVFAYYRDPVSQLYSQPVGMFLSPPQRSEDAVRSQLAKAFLIKEDDMVAAKLNPFTMGWEPLANHTIGDDAEPNHVPSMLSAQAKKQRKRFGIKDGDVFVCQDTSKVPPGQIDDFVRSLEQYVELRACSSASSSTGGRRRGRDGIERRDRPKEVVLKIAVDHYTA